MPANVSEGWRAQSQRFLFPAPKTWCAGCLRLAIVGQGELPPSERRRMTLIADELHAIPGGDYEAYLSELAKLGTSAVLATQGMGQLDALDKKEGRALRPTLFSNVDGLYAFQMSAEDASYLVHELGGGLEEDDLVELSDYRCYARLSVEGAKLPTFSLHLDSAPTGDATEAEQRAAHSYRVYGRRRADVVGGLRRAMVRVEAASGDRRRRLTRAPISRRCLSAGRRVVRPSGEV